MNHFCTAAALLGTNLCNNETPISAVEQGFISHMVEHNLSYGTKEEYEFRLARFQFADMEIQEINANPQNTFVAGHNQFSTWTQDEFKKMLGYIPEEISEDQITEMPLTNLSVGIDWRTKGALGAVKNQGGCGSCWAFAATGSVEAAHTIKTGKKLILSEQTCVDCAAKGCGGGSAGACYNASITNHFTSYAEYPYTAKTGTCHSTKGTVYASSMVHPTRQNVAAIKSALQVGPVVVAVEADKAPFQRYTGGIVNSADCGTSLNHAVLAVGWGTENGKQYYIIRNSWGTRYGESGHIRLAITGDGQGVCGVQMQPVYPITN